MVWTPFKALVYLMPFLLIFVFAMLANYGVILINFFIVVLIYTFYLFFWTLKSFFGDTEYYIVQNGILSFITYGSFVLFTVLPKIKISTSTHNKLVRLIRYFLVIQSVVGIAQILLYVFLYKKNFDGAAGDVVQGTINILSFNSPGVNFNNPIYSVNISLLLLFCIPTSLQRRRYLILVLGSISLLFASVLHVIVSLIVSILTTLVLFYFRRSLLKTMIKLIGLGLIILLALLLLRYIQPRNFYLFSIYYEKFVNLESPKTKITHKVFSELVEEKPTFLFYGLGLGQFSSRASLMGTGRYFGNFNSPSPVMSLLDNKESYFFRRYIYPLWYEYENNQATYGGSSMSKPFYSILSVFTELGGMLSIVILIVLIRYILQLRLYFINKNNPFVERYYAYSIVATVFFLFFISFIENYLEVTQAILVGLLMIKAFNPIKNKYENPANS